MGCSCKDLTNPCAPSPEVLARWNIPDWRRVEQYSEVPKLTRGHLRWEVLRRRKKYREAWRERGPRGHGFDMHSLLAPDTCWRDLPPAFSSITEAVRGKVFYELDSLTSASSLISQGVAFIGVDLFRPIGPQITEAAEVLEKLRVELQHSIFETTSLAQRDQKSELGTMFSRDPAEVVPIPESDKPQPGDSVTGEQLFEELNAQDRSAYVAKNTNSRRDVVKYLRTSDARDNNVCWSRIAADLWRGMSEEDVRKDIRDFERAFLRF